MKKYFVCLALIVGLLKAQGALVSQYENERIHEVRIRGNKIIQTTALKNKLQTKKQRRLKKKQVIEDVKALFELGYFNNIKVKAVKNKKNRLIIDFYVEEKPRIDSISYEGREALSKKKIEELVSLKVYEFLDMEKLKTSIENIKKGYEEKGYMTAKVSHRIEEIKKEKKIKLIIKIDEGEKILIKKIKFIGNKNLPDKKIKRYLTNREQGFFSFLTSSGVFKRENLKKDIQIIRQVYFEHGHLEVKVESPEVSFSPSQDGLYLTYRITEGGVFFTGSIDFKGDLLFSKVELRESFPLEPGDKLTYSKLQRGLLALQTKYGDKGYAFANIIPQFAYQDQNVHILLDIRKGELTHVRKIHISGNRVTQDKVIRREMKVSERELYHGGNVERSKAAIQRLGYFDEVQVQSQPLEKEGEVDLEFSVQERENFGMVQVGGGVSSGTGFFAQASASKQNLFGSGVTSGFELRYFPRGEILLSSQYIDPHLMDSDWNLGAELFISKSLSQKDLAADFFGKTIPGWFGIDDKKKKKEKADKKTKAQKAEEAKQASLVFGREFSMDQIGGEIRFGRWFNEWRVLSFLSMKDLVFDYVSDPEIFNISSVNGLRTSIKGQIEYDNRNDRLLPSQGLYSVFSLDLTERRLKNQLKKQDRFVESLFTVRLYHELFLNIIMKNSLQFGQLRPLRKSSIPFDRLYLLGGPSDLRGFEYFSVGKSIYSKKLEREAAYGGAKKLAYSLELRWPVIQKPTRMYLTSFFDMGQADDTLSLKQMKKNIGIGTIMLTPFGLIGLSWGWPLPFKTEEGRSWPDFQFHFSLGAEI